MGVRLSDCPAPRRIVVAVANCLLGDALWTWKNFLPEPHTHKTALVINYNRQAVEVLRDVVGLQVDDITTHPDPAADYPFMGIQMYHDWCARFLQRDPAVEYRFFRPIHDLTPFPFFTKTSDGYAARPHPWAPGGYITVQLDSARSWKRVLALRDVAYPLPVKSIAKRGELTLDGTETLFDQPLVDVANTLLGASLHVGINSSITVLAMLLGVPTVLANFGHGVGDWEHIPPTVRIVDVPTRKQIEDAIAELRDIYAAA